MKLLKFFLLVPILISCSSDPDKYSPSKHLSSKELDAKLWTMMRYLAKTPEGVLTTERFNPTNDTAYRAQMKLMSIDAWYREGDVHFFLVSKRAPSLFDKRVATGGKAIFDDDGGLKEYEEV